MSSIRLVSPRGDSVIVYVEPAYEDTIRGQAELLKLEELCVKRGWSTDPEDEYVVLLEDALRALEGGSEDALVSIPGR